MMLGKVVDIEGQNVGKESQYLSAVFEKFPQFYGGLDIDVTETVHGNVISTYQLPVEKQTTHEDRPPRMVILFQGARNPPTGEYYQLIRPLLEGGKVDKIVVLFAPMLETNQLPIINPETLAQDANEYINMSCATMPYEVVIGGISMGADIAAYTVAQRPSEDQRIKSLLLFEPVTFTQESREGAVKRWERAKERFPTLQRSTNRILAALLNAAVSGPRSAAAMLKLYDKVPATNDFFIKFDMPPNIASILNSLYGTIQQLGDLFEKKDNYGNAKHVHMYWAAKDLSELTEPVRGEAQLIAQKLGESFHLGTVTGTHGEIRGSKNRQSYQDAIELALDATL